jgi:hypothetical protein
VLTPEPPTTEFHPSPTDDPDPFFDGEDALLLDAIIDQLPEFLSVYVSLAEECDGDVGEVAVFEALADFVSRHLSLLETSRPVLVRAIGLVESLLNEPVDSVDPEESEDPEDPEEEDWEGDGTSDWEGSGDLADLVRFGFFDALSPEERSLLVPWLGPRSLAALESLDGAVHTPER